MEKNASWILNIAGASSKMMIGAHNAHVAKDYPYRRGYYLQKEFKEKFYSIGFDFYSGSLNAREKKSRKLQKFVTKPALRGTTGYVFSKCKHPDFYFDFSEAANNPPMKKFVMKNEYSAP